MPGVRIRHSTRRSQMLPVPLLHKPFRLPASECGACERATGNRVKHPCKVLHLNLDDTGSVIVSKEIWADLQKTARSGGFTMSNIVNNPPAQGITPPTQKMRIEAIPIGYVGDTVVQVSLDDYIDLANSRGVSTELAINNIVTVALNQLLRKG